MSEEKIGGFDILIEAFNIFKKYNNALYPLHCEHDILVVCGVKPEEVSQEDIERLHELKFDINEEDIERLHELEFDINEDDNYFYSYHFGSC